MSGSRSVLGLCQASSQKCQVELLETLPALQKGQSDVGLIRQVSVLVHADQQEATHLVATSTLSIHLAEDVG